MHAYAFNVDTDTYSTYLQFLPYSIRISQHHPKSHTGMSSRKSFISNKQLNTSRSLAHMYFLEKSNKKSEKLFFFIFL